MKYVDVILPVPLDGTFTYRLPDALVAGCRIGMRVLVPFGKTKTYAGLAVRIHDDAPQLDDEQVKDALSLLDDAPVVLNPQLRLWQWIADYYMSPIGDVMKAALPAGLKAESGYRPKTEVFITVGEKFRSPAALDVAFGLLRRMPKQLEVFRTFLSMDGREVSREALLNEAHCTAAILKRLVDQGFLKTFEREVGRLNTQLPPHPARIQPLSEAQAQAMAAIKRQWTDKRVVLLHGVTSSGKTEIYIHLIQEAIDRGEQVLYLLPEIALTVQMTQRLQRVFGSRLGIYHSKYSDSERVEIWRKQLSAQPYDIILGARSALFVPFQRLGLVIIDEEHETSFKQQDPAPRYHARSAAIVLAGYYGAHTLLGTATPSMESYYNARTGKYGLVTLTHRFKGIALPDIEVVDIKDLRHRRMMNGPFSPRLMAAMREALGQGKQVILFQNRRGFAPVLSCGVCGWTPKCPNCDVSLTYHKRLNQLTCHYCGWSMPVPDVCPCCGNQHLSDRGYGTEKIEDLVRTEFPEAKVARMDLDTTRTRNAYERIIDAFGAGRTNVLIGTQMISKGLDFDNVAVVGILDADTMLNYPDFRAYEHAFMMMSQVAGRAGRKGRQGLVILQTREANLPVIGQVVRNDYGAFFDDLLEERRLFHYPPFFHLIYIYLRHKQENVVEMGAQEMGAMLRRSSGDHVLGPDKPAVARIKNLFIRKIVLKLPLGSNLRQTHALLYQVRDQLTRQPVYRQLQVFFDVDPD
ncbi:MAG: primosomal protein N' [Prevotella sp.]|nr:primosomal protein N' [Prevotella sp.]